MTLLSTHAAKLEHTLSDSYGSPGPRLEGQGSNSVSFGARSGSTFNAQTPTFNAQTPTFNSLNQAAIGSSFGTGGISSSIVGLSQGNPNAGRPYGAPQGSRFAFGAPPAHLNPQVNRFNAALPGLTFTGFGPGFGQLPTTTFGGPPSPVFIQGLQPISPFTRTSGANFVPGQTSFSLSPISFGTANSQPSTNTEFGSEIAVITTKDATNQDNGSGSQFASSFGELPSAPVNTADIDTTNSQSSNGNGFESEFNVSPSRSSFNAPNLSAGISPGNLQSTIRFTSEPALSSTFVNGGSQRPSQGSLPNARFNADTNSGSTSFGSSLGSSSFDSTQGSSLGSTTSFGSTSGSTSNGAISGSTTFDFGRSSGVADFGSPSRGYLPPSA